MNGDNYAAYNQLRVAVINYYLELSDTSHMTEKAKKNSILKAVEGVLSKL